MNLYISRSPVSLHADIPGVCPIEERPGVCLFSYESTLCVLVYRSGLLACLLACLLQAHLHFASHAALVALEPLSSLHVLVAASQMYPCAGLGGVGGVGGVGFGGSVSQAFASEALVQPCSFPSRSAQALQVSVAFLVSSHRSRRRAMHSAGDGGVGGAGLSPSQYDISSRLVQLASSARASSRVSGCKIDTIHLAATVLPRPASARKAGPMEVGGVRTALFLRALVTEQLRLLRAIRLQQLLALIRLEHRGRLGVPYLDYDN